jgi:YVTN family beta-propeller protein
MTDEPPDPGTPGAAIKAFLIADVRGYTMFTQERGDEAAAKLAAKFAAVAREGVAARGGEVIELRGDEALAVFDSPRQAIRAAVDLQDRFVEETLADPAIPLTVGIGLDAGEAVPVEGGYRGGALNLAARLCGQAGPGEIMASQEIVHLARRIDGVRYADRGQVRLKGMSEPVTVVRVSSVEADAAHRLRPIAAGTHPAGGEEPPRRPSGVTRRRVLIVVVVLAVVAAGIAIPLSLGGGSSEPPSVAARPNSVARVDLETGGVVADTPLKSAPGAVAAGGGAIWVTEPDAGKVVRLDPRDGSVVDTVDVGIDPSGIAVGAGFVWVVNSGDPSVSRISLQTGDVVDAITTGIGNGPQDVAVGADAVWVTNRIDGTVSRIDPDRGVVTDTIPVPDTPTGIVARGDGVWVSGPSTGTVVRIDPGTNTVAGTTNVGNGPDAVQSDGSGIWVANTLDGTVTRIDPRSGSVDATVRVGDGPAAIAFGAGSAWVTNEFAGTISRIDVRTKRVRTVPLGSEPRGAAVAGGRLWVAARGAATSHRGGTLELIGDHAPDSIDPAVSYDAVSWYSLILIYDGLVGFKRVGGSDGGTLVPDLAESLPTPTDGGLTYRFTLRPGIRYSTGAPVRAADFRLALQRGFEIANTPVPLLYDVLAGATSCRPGHPPCDLTGAIETDDGAGTVTFHLAHPDSAFLYKLALPFAAAVPSGTASKAVTTDPIPGTGPYVISSYRLGRDLVLERNPHFREWSPAAQPEGFPDVIHWRFGPTPGQAVDAVESGAADWYSDNPPSDRIQEVVTRFAGQAHTFPRAATHYWAMNTRVPPFDDIRVRRAVNYATDREQLLETYGQRGARITCQDLPPNFQGYVPYCPYTVDSGPGGQWTAPDVGKARELLREAKAPHTHVTVWITDDYGPVLVAQARYFAGLLTRLGFPSSVHVVGDAVRYSDLVYTSPSRIQFAFSGWLADYAAASDFIATQFTCGSIRRNAPGANLNTAQLCDRDLDRRVSAAEAAEARDPELAGRLWAAADRAVVDLAPAVFVATPSALELVSARVGNYQRNPEFGILLDQVWVR